MTVWDSLVWTLVKIIKLLIIMSIWKLNSLGGARTGDMTVYGRGRNFDVEAIELLLGSTGQGVLMLMFVYVCVCVCRRKKLSVSTILLYFFVFFIIY